MNKLTTINTIKKAAPLVLLAVVLSGSAFAGKDDNPGKGPNKDRPDNPPQASVDVVTNCDICDYVDAYGNCIFDVTNPVLRVKATITDESGDGFSLNESNYVIRAATLLRKDKGEGRPTWDRVENATQLLSLNTDTGTWDTDLNVCTLAPTIDGANAFSAIVDVVVTSDPSDPNAVKTAFSSQCENIIVNEDPYDGIPDEDGIDQSNFDISELGIDCP